MTRPVYVDSNVFIYALNNDRHFGQQARQLFYDWELTQTPLVSSVLVLTEVLRKHQTMVEHAVRHTAFLELAAVTDEIAVRAAKLLEDYAGRLKPLDALHLATALEHRARAFVTNDQQLLSLKIKDLVIVGL